MMEGEFPEQFKCPICFEIPGKNIYQCPNGYTLCDVCVENLSLCPQCRVSLGNPKLRCKPLEDILDMMKFDCPYKQKGCPTKVSRADSAFHFENCWFGGDQVSLCKFIGYNCSYIFNTRRLNDSLNHLQSSHNCIPPIEKIFDMKLRNVHGFQKNQRCIWNPILVKACNSYNLIVIYSVQSNITFICICLVEETNRNVSVKFRVASRKDYVPVLEWTTTPVPLAESEIILKSPPFQLPFMHMLENYIVGTDLTIQINMTETQGSTFNLQNKVFAVNYHTPLQSPPALCLGHPSTDPFLPGGCTEENGRPFSTGFGSNALHLGPDWMNPPLPVRSTATPAMNILPYSPSRTNTNAAVRGPFSTVAYSAFRTSTVHPFNWHQ